MPKRARSSSTSSQQSITEVRPSEREVVSVEMEAVPEEQRGNSNRAAVAAQLDRLGVDEDLKNCILDMEPEEQRETISDIARNRTMEYAESAFMEATGRGFGAERAPGGTEPLTVDFDDDEEQLEEVEDDESEPDSDGDDSPHAHVGRGRRAAPGRGRGGGEANIMDLLQLLFANHMRGGMQGGRGRGMRDLSATMELMRMEFLRNLQASHAQQEALEAMGIHRDVDEMSYEELLDLEERMGSVSKGVAKEKVSSVMTTVSATAADGPCSICLDQLFCETTAAGIKPVSRLVNCSHLFHSSCIDSWLQDNKTCPICKKEVI